MLNQEQRATLWDEGFVVVDRVFQGEEMEELTQDLHAYDRRNRERLRRDRGGVEGISRADEIVFTSHIAEADPKVRAFCLRPELVSIATSVLGANIDLYWNQSVFKEPETRAEFPWHQDDGYTPVTPSPYLTLWLALNAATPENGCISVLPRWHKRGLLPHRETPLGKCCHELDHPEQGVMVPLAQGSLAVFWSLTPHKSGPNRSSGARNAYIVQYAKAGLRRASDGELIPNLIPVARDQAA
jgi:ectoine hydroxylase-related dioxygenase (phytanoyl-CoA dioxygenase family)